MRPDSICPDSEALISYLYDEFEEGAVHDRRSVARHLDACDRCAAEIAAFGSVRETLATWKAPDAMLGFRVVQELPAGARRWWPSWSPAFQMAAAATLVAGAALGLARIDIQYDASGLRVRTGWGQPEATSAAVGNATGAALGTPDATVQATSVVTPDPTLAGTTLPGDASSVVNVRSRAAGATLVSQPVTSAATAQAPWRTDLALLERQLRTELASLRQGQGAVAAPAGSDSSNPVWLRQVQQLIDQSEVRQQQNLALRMAEVSRDFDVQRRSDLVLIEQSFDRLAGQDAQQQRMLMNAIRVNQQQPPR